MTSNRPLVALRLSTYPTFHENLDHLVAAIGGVDARSIIVAPEVVLSGFAYDRFEQAADFSVYALERLCAIIEDQILIFSAIIEEEGHYYNRAFVLHHGRIVHEQGKTELFALADEHHHFHPDDEEKIEIVQIDGIKIGILICFELRFHHLWERLRGCDVIAVCAQWGSIRDTHLHTLTRALAIMHQCYVVVSDADNPDTTGRSGVINPFGEERWAVQGSVEVMLEPKVIQSMRRYLDVGIARG